MKIVVTHMSPDWDAIGSVWLIKKYLPGWDNAEVRFVPAGERYKNFKFQISNFKFPIEAVGEDEVIHVDTGMGPLDHHQTSDRNICAMSRTWNYVQEEVKKGENKISEEHVQAVSRIVRIVVEIDHFQEVYWKDPAADYHEFSMLGILDGLKQMKQDQDNYYVEFGTECLNALIHRFENRIWAEKEIENGMKFETKYGHGLGCETVNDDVLKLAQKMGYVITVRKDPRKHYVRIKALPVCSSDDEIKIKDQKLKIKNKEEGVDLTLAYEQLKKIDPDATWFLHVSKKMLLNGTPKNPKMRPTKLPLSDIIKVLEKL